MINLKLDKFGENRLLVHADIGNEAGDQQSI
jgi:hypothetical protein